MWWRCSHTVPLVKKYLAKKDILALLYPLYLADLVPRHFFSIFPELNTSVNLMKTFRTMWWQYWKGFQQIIPRNMRDTRMHMCMHKIRKTLWMCPHHPRFSDKTHTFFSGSVWISINQLQISHAQELVTRLVHSWHVKLCFAFSCLVY